MEAKRELRRDQEQRRKRDNLIAAGAGTAAVVLAVVLQLTAFAGNPTEDEFAATEAGLTNPSASATPSAPATNGPNIPADSAGGYTVVGKVTSGLDVVTGIAAAGITPGSSDTDGAPVQAVTIDSFSLK